MIVDEEQRFGVRQKELLRQLRLRVDVLSLSATPIPRTLQMSLAGHARHLGDRDAARGPAADPHLRRASTTRTWSRARSSASWTRGGQVFFLHDRVETIDEAAERLRALVPAREGRRSRTARWRRRSSSGR